MAKNQSQTPLVTSISTTLKKTIHSNTQVVTPEEIKAKKKDMMSIVDSALELFKNNLAAGKVDMTTSLDLERLVKLQLLLSGEADSRTGRPYGESEETVESTQAAEISMSKIEEILNLEDEEVKRMYEKLYKGYNEANDIDD